MGGGRCPFESCRSPSIPSSSSTSSISPTGFIASASLCVSPDNRFFCRDVVVTSPNVLCGSSILVTSLLVPLGVDEVIFGAEVSRLIFSDSSARRITSISPCTTTPSNQLWCTRSEALARLSGCSRSIGLRKEAIASASARGKRYLSCNTASRGQKRSLLMLRSSPGDWFPSIYQKD